MRWRFWRFWSRDEFLEAGERARLEHSEWLSRALRSGKNYPRIPVKPVVLGGFDRLMEKPGGPDLCAAWWQAAFNRVDHLDHSTDSDGHTPADDRRHGPTQ
ncbi:MAG: hypothetical protein KF859_12090 [Phycisphaeraceae bacterium]|nr:hypothetical protein [Phycisphaeraceae bacterium]